MGDRTALQATIHACPDEGLVAAWQAITSYMGEPEEGSALTRYIITDDTLSADGKPIRRGQEALRIPGVFATDNAATAHLATLPGPADRYSIDTVQAAELGTQYLVAEASCGSATELADELAEIPGIAFEVWEDPKYEWLGDLRMFTLELGHYSAECDANGTAVLTPEQIRDTVAKCRDEVQASLDPDGHTVTLSSSHQADVAITVVLEAIDAACGKPWRDAFKAISSENR